MGRDQALGSIFGTARPARAATPPGVAAAVPPGVAALLAAVDRVERAVEAETEALGRALDADLADFAYRKRQGLLEVGRALRASAPGASGEVRERLARFAERLERNRAALGTQLRAAREIAEVVAQAVRDAESDGTYAPAAAGRA